MTASTPRASPRSLAESLAVGLLGAAAIAAPLMLGAAGNWLRFALEATMATAVVLWAASATRPFMLAAMPLAVAAACLLQLVPLPDSVLVQVAPVSAGAWKVAQLAAPAAWGRISVEPAETAAAIRRLLLGLATLAAVTDLTRYQSHRKRLIFALAIAGLVILTTGLVFGRASKDRVMLGFVHLAGPITPHNDPTLMPIETVGAGTTEWVTVAGFRYPVDTGNVGDAFGTYIYSNHFAGGLILTLPVTLAAWLFITRATLPTIARVLAAVSLFGIAFWAIGPLASSRAGIGAFLVAGLSLAALIARPGWPRLTSVIFLIAAVVVILVVFVLIMGPLHYVTPWIPDSWRQPLGDILRNARTLAAQVGFRMFFASPLLGTGLGTFAAVFPRYSTDACMLFFAHNDYAQMLAEAGLAGAGIFAAFAMTLARRCVRFCRDAPPPYRILAAGPWAAVAGAAIHACFDWNLHLPANAFLAILVTGLSASSVPVIRPDWQHRLRVAIPQGMLIVATGACLMFMWRDAVAEDTRRSLRDAIAADRLAIRNRVPQADTKQLTDAVALGLRTAKWHRTDARLSLLIGQAMLHLANRTDDVVRRQDLVDQAERWMQTARGSCALCRGLAEVAQTKPGPRGIKRPPDQK